MKSRYFLPLMIFALSVLMLSCGCAKTKHLVILHTNDSHSQIEPVRTGASAGLGGVDRRYEYFKEVKKENRAKNVLILDAGDYNQGTPFFTLFKGDAEVEIMNALGYDAAVLGNHELDNGQEELARRIKMLNFPTLCANYNFIGTPLEGLIQPYAIFKRGGLKIGVVGLTVRLNALVMVSALEGLEYKEPIPVANELAHMLKEEEKCDIVIALSHLGYTMNGPAYASDLTLAEQSRNIDIIIGGHTHTYLTKESIRQNLDGQDVIITQVGSKGEYVGRFDLTVEK